MRDAPFPCSLSHSLHGAGRRGTLRSEVGFSALQLSANFYHQKGKNNYNLVDDWFSLLYLQ